jgi:trimethylguanosine synthase
MRASAHKLVQLDEQRILMDGMPDSVHLKYWDQRYRLLSLFDQGIKLDAESWYSITPEAVAKHVTAACIGRARELACGMNKVLDCFSGCGGNSIPFAAQGREVVSVDLDPVKLGYLR